MSTNTAVDTGSVKNGMASKALRDLHLWDNRLSLLNGWMYVGMKSSKTCTGKTLPPGNFNVRTPQQQSHVARKHSASKQTRRGGT